jgi:hypothetical protein
VAVPALAALRMYWGTVALLAGSGLLALAAFLPIAALLHIGPGPAARLGPWLERGADLGVGWSQDAQGPAATQQQGVDVLFHLLLGTAVATLAIAAVTILALFGARASRREPALSRFGEAAERVLDDLASAVVERRAPAPLPPLIEAGGDDLPQSPVLRVRLARLARQLKTLHDAIERWSTRRD